MCEVFRQSRWGWMRAVSAKLTTNVGRYNKQSCPTCTSLRRQVLAPLEREGEVEHLPRLLVVHIRVRVAGGGAYDGSDEVLEGGVA